MPRLTKREFAALFDQAAPGAPWSRTPKRIKAQTRKQQRRAAAKLQKKGL